MTTQLYGRGPVAEQFARIRAAQRLPLIQLDAREREERAALRELARLGVDVSQVIPACARARETAWQIKRLLADCQNQTLIWWLGSLLGAVIARIGGHGTGAGAVFVLCCFALHMTVRGVRYRELRKPRV